MIESSEELNTWDYHRNLAALDWLVSRYSPEFWGGELGDGGGGAADGPPVSTYARDFRRESSYNVWLSALRELDADTTSSD